LRDSEISCGGDSRSAGRGDRSGGRFRGSSDIDELEEFLLVSSGFVFKGVAFFGWGDE
jgi:hypothetical protein